MSPSNRSLFIALVLALSAGLFAFPARAADEVFVTVMPDGGTAAIRGYDAVAYHTLKAPVLGSAQFTFDWKGATWRFASAANRDLFAKDPAKYAPQYGGFCAFGTSRGYKVSTQPDQFAVVDGRLFLNYNAAVMTTWDKDRPHYIATADENWLKIQGEAYESDLAAAARIEKQKQEKDAARAAKSAEAARAAQAAAREAEAKQAAAAKKN